jgi:hypothetical protein
MSPERAADLIRQADFPLEPTVKRVIVSLLDRVEALEFAVGPLLKGDVPWPSREEVAECLSRISSLSSQSSEKTPDGTGTVSPKPARKTATRSKRSTGGTTAGPGTS